MPSTQNYEVPAEGAPVTLESLAGIVRQGFGRLDARMGNLDARMGNLEVNAGGLEVRMGNLDARMGGLEVHAGGLEARMDKGFEELHERIEKAERVSRLCLTGLDIVKERVEDVHRRTVNLEHRVEDIRDTLDGLGQAIDKDAETVMGHERRIVRIERRFKAA